MVIHLSLKDTVTIDTLFISSSVKMNLYQIIYESLQFFIEKEHTF